MVRVVYKKLGWRKNKLCFSNLLQMLIQFLFKKRRKKWLWFYLKLRLKIIQSISGNWELYLITDLTQTPKYVYIRYMHYLCYRNCMGAAIPHNIQLLYRIPKTGRLCMKQLAFRTFLKNLIVCQMINRQSIKYVNYYTLSLSIIS